MKIGAFADGDRIFIGAVFNEQAFDFSAASLQVEKEALPDLGPILRQERFGSKLFHDLFMLGPYREDFWIPLYVEESDSDSEASCKEASCKDVAYPRGVGTRKVYA